MDALVKWLTVSLAALAVQPHHRHPYEHIMNDQTCCLNVILWSYSSSSSSSLCWSSSGNPSGVLQSLHCMIHCSKAYWHTDYWFMKKVCSFCSDGDGLSLLYWLVNSVDSLYREKCISFKIWGKAIVFFCCCYKSGKTVSGLYCQSAFLSPSEKERRFEPRGPFTIPSTFALCQKGIFCIYTKVPNVQRTSNPISSCVCQPCSSTHFWEPGCYFKK